MRSLSNTQKEKVYTILQLNTVVRDLIRTEFPDHVWVCGEIKDLRASRDKRHVYFELIEKHPSANEVVARVSAALFEGRKATVFARIEATHGAFQLKNDIEVKFLCKVDLYPKNGQYSVIIVDIDPVYTLGKLAQNRQKIIHELTRSGLIEKNKALQLPEVILKVALITASDSAAYHDFTNELSVSGFGYKLFVYNCYMQGKNVERDVVGALTFFNKLDKDKLDVIAITRGGGSTADLSWFDNKNIAVAIARSRFPVLTALGHQINETIADLVAHTSLKTPTKLAQFLIEHTQNAFELLKELAQDIMETAVSTIENNIHALQTKVLKIDSLTAKYFRDHRVALARKHTFLVNTAAHTITLGKRNMLEIMRSVKRTLATCLQEAKASIRYSEDKVRLLDPRVILKRGYSMTLIKGKTIKSHADLSRGDMIKTVFFKGWAESEVKKIGEDNE